MPSSSVNPDDHSLSNEYNTLSLVQDSNFLSYFLKRFYVMTIGMRYDYNLFLVLDYAIQTKRKVFIDRVLSIQSESKDQFAVELLKAFDEQVASELDTKENRQSLKKIKKALNSYFDSHGLFYHISTQDKYPHLKQDVRKTQIADEIKQRQHKRNIKQYLIYTALFLAVLVAIPEAALAVYISGAALTATVFFKTFVPVFNISYLMYRPDLIDEVKLKFGYGKSKEYKNISRLENIILNVLLFFTCLVIGCLYFNSVYVPLGELAFGLPTAAAVWGSSIPALIAVSGVFALAIMIANFALFKPIAFDIYQGLKELYKQFKEKPHFNLIKCLFFIPSVVVFFLSQYMFANEVHNFVHGILSVSEKLSWQIGLGIACIGFINGFFYAKNLYIGLELVYNKVIDSLLQLKSLFLAQYSLSNLFDNHLDNKRVLLDLAYKSVFIVLAYCCYINAAAMGSGILTLLSGAYIVKQAAVMLVATASMFGNGIPCSDVCALPLEVSSKDAEDLKPKENLDTPAVQGGYIGWAYKKTIGLDYIGAGATEDEESYEPRSIKARSA